jgi:hypothetical protein
LAVSVPDPRSPGSRAATCFVAAFLAAGFFDAVFPVVPVLAPADFPAAGARALDPAALFGAGFLAAGLRAAAAGCFADFAAVGWFVFDLLESESLLAGRFPDDCIGDARCSFALPASSGSTTPGQSVVNAIS